MGQVCNETTNQYGLEPIKVNENKTSTEFNTTDTFNENLYMTNSLTESKLLKSKTYTKRRH